MVSKEPSRKASSSGIITPLPGEDQKVVQASADELNAKLENILHQQNQLQDKSKRPNMRPEDVCITYSKSENVLMVSAVRLPQTDSNHAACSIPNVVSSSFEMPLIENMAATVARNVCSSTPTTAHPQYLTSAASHNPVHSSTPRALNAGNQPKMNQTGLHLTRIKGVILIPHF